MDLKQKLESVLHRIRQSRRELSLYPDVFQASENLKAAEADLAAIISELFPQDITLS
jgi:hypothetical protein